MALALAYVLLAYPPPKPAVSAEEEESDVSSTTVAGVAADMEAATGLLDRLLLTDNPNPNPNPKPDGEALAGLLDGLLLAGLLEALNSIASRSARLVSASATVTVAPLEPYPYAAFGV